MSPPRQAPAGNPIEAENLRPGNVDWELERPARQREIEGYASACSVQRGACIQLFVSTAAPEFRLEVFRMGWYQGHGARRVFGPTVLPGRLQAMPPMDAATGLVDCNWACSFTLRTADADTAEGWLSGVYLARLTASGNGAQSYLLFVVREDERAARWLVQVPVTTYQAYNNWGGKSLYNWGSSAGERAAKVSFNRPRLCENSSRANHRARSTL